MLLLQVASPVPQNGEAVLSQMHDRWNGKWAKTYTFVQQTSYPDRPAQTWYETVEVPGRLRIDFGPIDSMNTAIMKNDSVYQYRRGALRGARPYPNTLGALLSDVYAQPVARTAAYLRATGFNLDQVRADTWQGHPVWVVGATVGDSTSPQFWVDQQKLVLDRIVDPQPNGPSILGEVIGREAGPIPVENSMRFLENGVEVQREVYTQLKIDSELDPWIFETGEWKRPSWIGR
jgi:hypothetical protein